MELPLARVELTIKGGRTSFQQGEIVPLVLSYASAVTGRYSADTRNYDRSGRLEIETYCIEPSAPDPLKSYFENESFMGGGLGGSQPLGPAPYVFEANLNEYATLAPGRYRLYAVYERLRAEADKNGVTLVKTADDPSIEPK